MRNCVKRKKVWQKESHKPVAVAVRLRSASYVVSDQKAYMSKINEKQKE